MNPLSEKKREELATEIFEWLVKNELWVDVCIYFNGKRWSTHNQDTEEYYYNQHKYYEDEANPREYFDYVREPENILSMSFEGPLYYVLNGYGSNYLAEEFLRFLRSMGFTMSLEISGILQHVRGRNGYKVKKVF